MCIFIGRARGCFGLFFSDRIFLFICSANMSLGVSVVKLNMTHWNVMRTPQNWIKKYMYLFQGIFGGLHFFDSATPLRQMSFWLTCKVLIYQLWRYLFNIICLDSWMKIKYKWRWNDFCTKKKYCMFSLSHYHNSFFLFIDSIYIVSNGWESNGKNLLAFGQIRNQIV